jgi:hypothetical protein
MTNATKPRAKLLAWLLTAAMVLSLSPAFAPTARAASGYDYLHIGIDDNVNGDTTDTQYYDVTDLGYYPELPGGMSLSYDGDGLLILTVPGGHYEWMSFFVYGTGPAQVDGVMLNITADTVIDGFQFSDGLNGDVDTLVITSLNGSTLTLEDFSVYCRQSFITGDINIKAPANQTIPGTSLKTGGIIHFNGDLTISTLGKLNVGGIMGSDGDISIASTVNTDGTGIFSTPGNDIFVKGSARVTIIGQMENGDSNSQFSAGGNLIIEDNAVVAMRGGYGGVSAWSGGELTVKDNATLTVESDGNGIDSGGGDVTIRDNAKVTLNVPRIGVVNPYPHQSTPKLTVADDAVLTISGAEQGIYWGSGAIEIADRAVVTASGSKNAIETRFTAERHGDINITASPYVYKTSAAANGAGFTQGVYPGSAFVNSSEYKYVKILGGVSSDPNPTEPAAPTYPLQSISLNRTSATLTTGSSIQLSVTYNPANTTDDRRVTWTSDRPAVAAVSETGLVTASNTTTGSAIITATVGDHKATCDVTVTEPSSDPGPQPSGPSGGGITPPVEPKTEEAQEETQPVTAAETAPALTSLRDVAASDWYYEDVKFVTENGLFKGVSATEFAPNARMTRAMLATVLHRLAGEPAAPAGQSSFGDVPAGQWFTEAVAWASANGVIGGYGANVFGTNDPVTREQIAVLLYRYAKLMGYDVSASADLSAYTDAADISEWAREALAWANAAGIITGRGASALAPTDTATRAEVAAMLHRFAEL